MPRSKLVLFTSNYSNHDGIEVGNVISCKIKAYRYQPQTFRVVEIEKIVEDGRYRYVYWGVPVVVIKK